MQFYIKICWANFVFILIDSPVALLPVESYSKVLPLSLDSSYSPLFVLPTDTEWYRTRRTCNETKEKTLSPFFRNLTCQETLVLRNNRNIQIVCCQINPHKHSQRATDLMFTAALVFLLEKSVNLPLNSNTLSFLRVTPVTGAISPAFDVSQLLSINKQSVVYCGRYIHLQTSQCLS